MSLKRIVLILINIVTWEVWVFCMEPASDTELLNHMLDLDARVKKYARHLQDENMLAKLNKDDVIA